MGTNHTLCSIHLGQFFEQYSYTGGTVPLYQPLTGREVETLQKFSQVLPQLTVQRMSELLDEHEEIVRPLLDYINQACARLTQSLSEVTACRTRTRKELSELIEHQKLPKTQSGFSMVLQSLKEANAFTIDQIQTEYLRGQSYKVCHEDDQYEASYSIIPGATAPEGLIQFQCGHTTFQGCINRCRCFSCIQTAIQIDRIEGCSCLACGECYPMEILQKVLQGATQTICSTCKTTYFYRLMLRTCDCEFGTNCINCVRKVCMERKSVGKPCGISRKLLGKSFSSPGYIDCCRDDTLGEVTILCKKGHIVHSYHQKCPLCR